MAKPQRLPGMEDGEIEALQLAAIEYADIRDERQRLTTQEVELKMKLLRLMKEYKKSTYEYGGVEIELVTVEETVKVKVHKPDGDEGEPKRPLDAADALCRLCQAPNPSFITHDGKFFYCEKCAVNKQEGEVLKRIRDTAKAGAIVDAMREPGDESEQEPPREDPLKEDINQRNQMGRRKKKAARVH